LESVPAVVTPALTPRGAGRPVGSRSSYHAALEHQIRNLTGVKGTLAVDPLLRPAECCTLLQISYSTLRKRITEGVLRASRTTQKKGGHLRIRFSDLRKFVADSAVRDE